MDLRAQHAQLRQEILDAVSRVLEHGQFILGPEVEEFERRFAALCGTRHAVGVNSGTDALILALRAAGIGRGDEVITAPNSFVATGSAIVLVGARPVFADVRDDYNIDPEQIRAAITPRTKAILPVHLTGRPADMDPILEMAQDQGLAVVEDAAQAVTAEYRGRRVGSFGTLGCFSLHPLKTLSACGDAGVVTTNDEALAERLRILRNIGLRTRENCVEWSGNSRLDTLQAAILLVKLNHLEAWTERRRANARAYREHLEGARGVEIPDERPHERAVYHTFVIQADRRDELAERLRSAGIGTAIHYPRPIHMQDAAAHLGLAEARFPRAESQAKRILSLPVHEGLGQLQIASVGQAVREFHEP